MKINLLDIDFKTSANASELTTMKTPAKLKAVFYPKSQQELTFLYDYLSINNIPFIVLGNGSNVIFTEKAKNLIVISTKKLKQTMFIKENIVTVSASVKLSKIYRFCQEKGLSGFEKLAGIPGTIGGAIFMNAGCFDASISDNLIAVKIFKAGKIKWIKKQDLYFNYRESSFKDCLILSVKFACQIKDKCEIEQDFLKYTSIRLSKQPKGYSAGSIFKNSPTYSAGELIDRCGLKGFTIGGAKISEKHANFIINDNEATSKDVISLISLTKTKVYEKFKIKLEEEVKLI